jgi:transcriptional regulator with XRE-family HTH domain
MYGIMEGLKEDDMDQNKVGLFIQERRKYLNMTQSDLARTLHVSDQAVSKWERGLNYPDIELISSLADLLKVSVSDILQGELSMSELKTEEAVKEVLDYSSNVLKKEKKRFSKKIMVLRLSVVLFIALGMNLYIEISHPHYVLDELTPADQNILNSDYKPLELLFTSNLCDGSQNVQLYTVHKKTIFGINDNLEGFAIKFHLKETDNKLQTFCPVTLEVNMKSISSIDSYAQIRGGTLLWSDLQQYPQQNSFHMSSDLSVSTGIDLSGHYQIYDISEGKDSETLQLYTRFTFSVGGYTFNGSTASMTVNSTKNNEEKRIVPKSYITDTETGLIAIADQVLRSWSMNSVLDRNKTNFYKGSLKWAARYTYKEERRMVYEENQWWVKQIFSSADTIVTFTTNIDQTSKSSSIDIIKVTGVSSVGGVMETLNVITSNELEYWPFPKEMRLEFTKLYGDPDPWSIEGLVYFEALGGYTHYRITWPLN